MFNLKKKNLSNFVVVVLQGGLGNQLFQYSFGKFLEKKFKFKIIFDNRYFTTVDKNLKWQEKFRLNFFNINTKKFTNNTSKIHFKYFARFRHLFGKIYFLNFFKFFLRIKCNKIFIDLSPTNYDFYIKNLTINSIYIGHWETKYFADKISYQIKKDLTQNKKNYGKLNKYIKKINSKIVMVHFSDTSHWTDYEKIDDNFYRNGIKIIKKKLKNNIHFHIFSKNYSYAKKMAKKIFDNNDNLLFMSKENLKDHEEFYLMRQYENFIVPNSTFSWWAAYLSEKKSKLIIIPKKWYYGTLTTKDKIAKNMLII